MRRTFYRSRTVLIFCMVLFGVTVASAQDSTISGIIVDSYGARIPEATIQLKGRNATKKLSSDGDGFFKGDLPSGRYLVAVERYGFSARKYRVFLRTNTVVALNIILHPKPEKHDFKCPKGETCIIL